MSLPFQTVETVNESAQDRQRSLFAPGFREEEWRNHERERIVRDRLEEQRANQAGRGERAGDTERGTQNREPPPFPEHEAKNSLLARA